LFKDETWLVFEKMICQIANEVGIFNGLTRP